MKTITCASALVLVSGAVVSGTPLSPPALASRDYSNLQPIVAEAMRARDERLSKMDLHKRDDVYKQEAYNFTDPDEMCSPTFKDADEAASVWWRTGAGEMLDYWIKNRAGGVDGKATDWWDKLINYVWDVGAPLDCTTLTGGGCEIPQNLCRELVPQGLGQFYWIIKQITTANLGYVNLHEMYLQNGAIENGLDIPQFIKDFTPDPVSADEVPTVFGYLSSIFLLVGGAGGTAGISPWGGMVSFLGSLFGLVDKWKEGDDEGDEIDLNQIVSDYFKKAEENLLGTLHNLIGKGDQQDLYPSLFSGEDYYDSPTAKTLADGKFLKPDIGVYMDPIIKEAKNNMNIRLALYVLQQQGMWLQIVTGFTEGACWPEGYSWVDGNCMRFIMPGTDEMDAYCNGMMSTCGGKIKVPKELDKKYTDKLNNDFKIDWKKFHENAYKCAQKDGKKEIDTTKLPVDGSLPECYLAIDMKKGKWDNTGGEKWIQEQEWKVSDDK
ncbi:hypothetical protein F4778DRAFT_711686 [Xylariomycetidae sp. FL2044]|nr:hypothetical protein F4778DRAFT_711686 [Xylariomycetidae sp. FL2044]